MPSAAFDVHSLPHLMPSLSTWRLGSYEPATTTIVPNSFILFLNRPRLIGGNSLDHENVGAERAHMDSC